MQTYLIEDDFKKIEIVKEAIRKRKVIEYFYNGGSIMICPYLLTNYHNHEVKIYHTNETENEMDDPPQMFIVVSNEYITKMDYNGEPRYYDFAIPKSKHEFTINPLILERVKWTLNNEKRKYGKEVDNYISEVIKVRNKSSRKD